MRGINRNGNNIFKASKIFETRESAIDTLYKYLKLRKSVPRRSLDMWS